MGKHVIIGGLGNIGRHIQRVLLENGRTSVTVLDRPRSSPELEHASVKFVPYTLGSDDPSQLTQALQGCETVYSVVTPDVQYGTVGEFDRTNRVGIQHLVESCQQAGVAKLVHASSIAVTNHFVDSHNQDESMPLPKLSSYASHYDRTKRLGEELVLQVDPSKLKACALRLGGVLASPRDYYMRQSFEQGAASGIIHTIHGAAIDTIAGQDVARAMVLADSKLESTASLVGTALFVSKSNNETVPKTHEITDYMASRLGWKIRSLPSAIFSVVQAAFWMQYQGYTKLVSKPDELPGIPPHLYIQLPLHTQTFNNSLARKLLDFEPELSWEQAVDAIIDDYDGKW